jgi:LDH2 family malate/lactate/ureidoglycolate dehydrogenase
MNVLDIQEIERWTNEVLTRNGLRESDSRWVAKTLTFAEIRGVGTHGLMRLPVYVERIRNGGINRNATFGVEADLGALVIMNADDGPGAASGVYGADLAVERARRHGIGCAIAHSANHFGISAFYTNRIADAGLIGIAICNTESVMCAPFGGRPVLGTNPLAVAPPLPGDIRPQLDMATTTTSQGKLLVAERAGQSIPLGWAVDPNGRPTESASDGLAGALLPSGGAKGFGIAFAIDAILAISGANVSPEVGPLQGAPTRPQRLGQGFFALRTDGAGSLDDYRRKIAALVDAIHRSGFAGQESSPLAPGEPELARSRQANGRIRLGDDLMKELARLADRVDLPLPTPVQQATGAAHSATGGRSAR